MNVSLPENLREYVEAKVRAGGYGSASEFIRELLRAAMGRETKDAELRELVQLGLEQLQRGESLELSDAELPKFFDKVRARARARSAKDSGRRA